MEWSIGSLLYGSNISSETGAGLTNVFQYNNSFGYDVLESTFSLTGVLMLGTYWFTLQNAVSTNGNPAYWDQNNGPSSAQENVTGSIPI